MKTKSQTEWVDFFIDQDVPGMPVHTLPEVVEDPHFQARANLATENQQFAWETVLASIFLQG